LNLDRATQRPEETTEERNEEYATVINIRVLGKVLDLNRGSHSQENKDKTPRVSTQNRVKAKIISDRRTQLPISQPRRLSCCRAFASEDVTSPGEATASEKEKEEEEVKIRNKLLDFAPGNQKPEATKERMSEKILLKLGPQ
jgi:hypothetical protein